MKTVSTRALIGRINMNRKAENEKLRKTRGNANRADLGDYYLLDVTNGFLVEKHVDVEHLGRKLGALKADEKLRV